MMAIWTSATVVLEGSERSLSIPLHCRNNAQQVHWRCFLLCTAANFDTAWSFRLFGTARSFSAYLGIGALALRAPPSQPIGSLGV